MISEMQGIEQFVGPPIPDGWQPPHEEHIGVLLFVEGLAAAVLVPLMLDIAARWTDWVEQRSLEFTGLFGVSIMLGMWAAMSRDWTHIHHYGELGLAIAYGTTLLHQRTKPQTWEPSEGEETTAIHDIRRMIRGTGERP